jgi:peptide/nickel transport system ATP-binding protein
VIHVAGLSIVDGAGRAIIADVTFSIRAGERVGLVGESGSGKTTLALSLLGAVRPGLRLAGGDIGLGGHDPVAARPAELRALRRRLVAYLPQDPGRSLTPTIRIGSQISELTGCYDPADIGSRLEVVGLPGDAPFQRRYPHQLSGGQLQRLALARVLGCEPRALILDEPTTGLDTLVQRRVLDELRAIVAERGLTLLVISHDLAAVSSMAERLLVLRAGELVEDGPLPATITAPRHPYTAELVASVPDVGTAAARRPAHARSNGDQPDGRDADAPLLEVNDLHAGYRSASGTVVAADGVSFALRRRECIALVGQSGSGKTTIARTITGLHRPTAGTIRINGLDAERESRRRSVEVRRIVQLVPQDPASSLNPRRRVVAAVARPLRVLHGLGGEDAREEALRLLSLVGVDPALASHYPRALSGGERQRVAIARSLAARPELLICDEVTSALDARVQAGILDLIEDLRVRLGLGVILISHDLGVVARAADRVLVLADGRICERGPVWRVLTRPDAPQTRALLGASLSLSALLQ